MSLPETTVSDLGRMGVTKEGVAQRLRDSGITIDGDVISLNAGNYSSGILSVVGNVLGENHAQAHNYLVSDWTVDRIEGPRLKSNTEYSESFENFSGADPVSQTYHRSHQITTTVDYTLTKNWDVSVNGNIPLGSSGAALGFSATKSESEVKHESKSETETKDMTYQIQIPAKEGIIIKEVVKVFETTTTYRARIGVQGNIGITTDPGFWTPNHLYVGDASQLAPGAGTDAFITRTDTKTDVTMQKLKMTAPGATATAEVLEVRTTSFGSGSSPQTPLLRSGVSLMLLEPDMLALKDQSETTNNVARAMFVPNTNLTIHVHFSGEIAAANRRTILMTFLSRIVTAATPLGPQAISRPSILFTDGADDATISFRFDSALTTRANMTILVTGVSNTITWGGSHMVTFV